MNTLARCTLRRMNWWIGAGARAGVATLVGAILLASPSTSVAARSTMLPLIAGQGVTVSGSKTRCHVEADSGYGLKLKGKTYIVCGPSTKVRGGGYVALMESDGRVVILSPRTNSTASSPAPTAH